MPTGRFLSTPSDSIVSDPAFVDPLGASVPRLEARDKVTGAARYIDDYSPQGMLFAALAQSPHAHARIRSYDLSKARALPGVKAIVTGADLGPAKVGGIIKDESMVARGKVRYVGEPVAAVAARDPDTARLAAQLIEIDYEPLPAVLSIDAALADGAPLLHEDLASYVKTMEGNSRGNIVWDSLLQEGDPEAAFAQCDVVVEAEYRTQAQQHAYLETNGVLAETDSSGKITVLATCQSVHYIQIRVAEELGVPMSQVRVQVPRVGGGFGGKHASNIHSIAAWLARVDRQAGEAGAVAHAGLRSPALAPSGAHLDEDRREARRHHPRARRGNRARRRRLRRRKPDRARVRAADGARTLSHAERAHPGHRRLHQQAARRIVPRLRQSAGELRGRIADRRACRASSAWIRSSCG